MTTDTKAVARYMYGRSFGQHPQGEFVRFTDHEQVVAEMRNVAQVMLDNSSAEITSLRSALAAKSAEVEGFRKDAERYRWLRDEAPEEWDISIERGCGPQNDRITEVHVQDYLDDAIDAAMEKSNEHQDQ